MRPARRALLLLSAFGLMLSLGPALVAAQVTTADLVGTIRDSSGAVQ